MKRRNYLILAWLLAVPFVHGCTVVKVVDITASTALGVGKGAVKVSSAVVGAAVPDGSHPEKDE